MKKPLEILKEEMINSFADIHERQPNADDLAELENLFTSEESFVFGSAMEKFASQEKLQAEKVVLEEMANGWLDSEKENEKIIADSNDDIIDDSPVFTVQGLVDHLNFEVFRHRYPQITFENGGDRITVSIRE